MKGLTLLNLVVLLSITLRAESAEPSVVPSTANQSRTIEARLRDLEYPELRKRTPEEIKVLKRLVKSTEEIVRIINVREAAGVGKDSEREISLAARHRELARAELAWAEGRVQEAYRHTFRAVDFARQELNGVDGWNGADQDYHASHITVDFFISATLGVTKTELLLIRAEKVARAANVDLSKIKTEEEARRKEIEQPKAPHKAFPAIEFGMA
jgi:hypothetical protein